mmetsp:Transcript_10439/g.23632  ORF Transcript_10439/g.23632 Transcript_10439/m.23632 type:complete len:624 (+) Transcript_10439:44-1915(+)
MGGTLAGAARNELLCGTTCARWCGPCPGEQATVSTRPCSAPFFEEPGSGPIKRVLSPNPVQEIVDEEVMLKSSTKSTSTTRFSSLHCLAMNDFLALDILLPHEEVERKLLCPSDEQAMHFISHEWLGFEHPDPDGVQLRCMQEVFKKIMAGPVRLLFDPETWQAFQQGAASDFSHFSKAFDTKVAPDKELDEETLQRRVSSGCVWMDYYSVPQRNRTIGSKSAVRKVLECVVRCDFFWVCAPSAKHAELKDQRDFFSWRRRSWCRLEALGSVLSSKHHRALVVTDCTTLGTFGWLDAATSLLCRPDRSVANGLVTCCQLKHKMSMADGSVKALSCDRKAMEAPLAQMWTALYEEQVAEHGAKSLGACLLRSITPAMFAGFESAEQRLASPSATIDEFMKQIGYAGIDSRDALGNPPLLWAVLCGSMDNVREFVWAQPEALHVRNVQDWSLLMHGVHRSPSEFGEFLMLDNGLRNATELNHCTLSGITAVDRAAKDGCHENLRTLMQLKAAVDPFRKDNGATPLMSAAAEGYATCCQVLIQFRANVNAVNTAGRAALHLAVRHTVVYTGNADRNGRMEVIDALLTARADPHLADHEGRTAMQLASELGTACDAAELLTARRSVK